VVILCPWICAVGSSWARVVLAVHCILSRVDGRLVGVFIRWDEGLDLFFGRGRLFMVMFVTHGNRCLFFVVATV